MTPPRPRIVALFAALLMLLALAAEALASYPMARNFKRAEYDGGAQNWAIAQAPDGSMIFGNSYGALVYNSASWLMLPVPNNTTVRSVYIPDGGERMYVGASGEFGYFSPRPDGFPVYTSLLPLIGSSNAPFSEIWNIIETRDRIWFQSDTRIFCYDGHAISTIDAGKKITASQAIAGVVYLAFSDGTLATVDARGNSLSVKQVKASGLPIADRIVAILPHSGGVKAMIVTQFSGLYELDGREVTPHSTPFDKFMAENQVFCATRSGDKIAIGTVKGGVMISDISAGSRAYLNIDTGLQNNTVLCAAFDRDGNLWLGLDNGIDYIHLNSPVYRLLGDNERYGAGYVSSLVGETLYLGTNQGLFSTPYPSRADGADAPPAPIIQGQIWSIDHIGDDMFVSSDVGLYCKHHGAKGFEKIAGIPGAISVIEVPERDDLALVSTYDNFYCLQRGQSGRWSALSPVAGYADIGGHPLLDNDGSIWLTHWIKGVYRLHFNPERMLFDQVELYDDTRGFMSSGGIRANYGSQGIVFTTAEGIYRYDQSSGAMVPHREFNSALDSSRISVICPAPWGQRWAISPSSLNVVGADNAVDSISFRYLADKFIPGYEHLNFISPGRVIVAGLEGFYDVNPRYDASGQSSAAGRAVRISSIYAGRDSLLTMTSIFADSTITGIKLSHDVNALTFNFVAPEYRGDAPVTYSYKLDGYDSDWSPYAPATSKEYSRLAPGSYTFRVRALDPYTGEESETAAQFSIMPPWYLSTVAKIIYLLIFIAAAWQLLRWINRRLRAAALRQSQEKEKELQAMRLEATQEALSKDVEIERLKSEQLRHDIKHKSNELSNVTMNMMRKNEILLDISDRLDKMAESVADTPARARIDKQIATIKKLIRENISHDDDWRSFARNFDIVYEKYLARLLERFPDLTQREQRLCAYIRMGLSSKEIAPLMNISFRSVEMNRYRLRKKMGLDGDTALSDFLMRFPQDS